MANQDKIKYFGKIGELPWETVDRSDEWSENRVAQISIVGKYADLKAKNVKPADSASVINAFMDEDLDSQYYIRTVSLTREDGDVGRLNVSLVKCPDGKNKPFNVQWDVSMEEVQKKLITHPIFDEDKECRTIIHQWEETVKAQRVLYNKDGKPTFYYQTADQIVQGQMFPIKIENEYVKAYCNAVTAGIETYNVYLPIIVKTSQYLELPGLDYDSESRIVESGTISEFSKEDQIGRFDGNMEISIAGFDDREKGLWFKSGDKFTQGSDGTWTRVETWTYTNDTRHKWIYTHSKADFESA